MYSYQPNYIPETTIPNKGCFFTEWQETFYPSILQGKLTQQEHVNVIKNLNQIRRIGMYGSLVFICFYVLFLILYPIFLFGILNCGISCSNWLPLYFIIFGIGFIFSVILSIWRYRQLRIKLENAIIFYNEQVYHPKGLHLHWCPSKIPILRIENLTSNIPQYVLSNTYQYIPVSQQVPYPYGYQQPLIPNQGEFQKTSKLDSLES